MNRAVSKRVFVVIDLPQVLNRRLKAIQEKARRLTRFLRPVDPANLHFTLLFLGSRPVAKRENIRWILKDLARETPAFRLRAGRFGFFPGSDQSLSWHLRLLVDDHLLALRKKLIQRLSADDPSFSDDREFQPHITLGRFRSGPTDRPLREKFLLEPARFESWSANRLSLLESDLGFSSPRYHLIVSYPLGQ